MYTLFGSTTTKLK